jgi:hypothetical protein
LQFSTVDRSHLSDYARCSSLREIHLVGLRRSLVRDGKSFEEFRVAEEQATKLLGTVVIRERNPHTFGDDVRQMLERRLTFEEAIRAQESSLVSKQRLEIVRRELFDQLDKLALD